MNVVEVKDISFSYDEHVEAIKHVSFNIQKGSYVTIVGHNGSGKSTLAKLLAGLLPLKEGEIIIDVQTLNEENIGDIRFKLGIVFQNPDNQFIGSTVRDDMAFGLENYQVPSEKMDGIINHFAEIVGMQDYLDSEPTNLSGGQKQRVAIAGILAMNPEIIIFDEATSMLDPKGKAEIKEVIQKLHQNEEITIISITHDIEEALNSDYMIVMNQGSIYMDGKPTELFKHKQEFLKIGLDIPFTYKVAEEFKHYGYKVDDFKDMEGLVEAICQLHLKK